jgi:glycosyltransferase involved in cell wall biosynthesis
MINSNKNLIINSTKPWVLIPAYEPTTALLELVKELLESEMFAEIILVDDGSSQSKAEYIKNVALLPGVTLLTHAVNRGKGQALKTGLNYFLLKSDPLSKGVVTADADGQHLTKDIIAVTKDGMASDAFSLGVRDFSPSVPWRNRLGNILTRLVFRLFTGVKIQDTQTGLRFIPRRLVGNQIRVSYDRFEYEFAVLVSESLEPNEKLIQVPISTVYIDGNRSSHFRHFRDSLAIYKVFLKFTSLSFITSLFDYLFFIIIYFLSTRMFLSFVIARIMAVAFNFCFSKRWIFQYRHKFLKKAVKYLAISFIFMSITYYLTFFIISITQYSYINRQNDI